MTYCNLRLKFYFSFCPFSLEHSAYVLYPPNLILENVKLPNTSNAGIPSEMNHISLASNSNLVLKDIPCLCEKFWDVNARPFLLFDTIVEVRR